jgi:hypothetical protein
MYITQQLVSLSALKTRCGIRLTVLVDRMRPSHDCHACHVNEYEPFDTGTSRTISLGGHS